MKKNLKEILEISLIKDLPPNGSADNLVKEIAQKIEIQEIKKLKQSIFQAKILSLCAIILGTILSFTSLTYIFKYIPFVQSYENIVLLIVSGGILLGLYQLLNITTPRSTRGVAILF